MVDEQMRRGIKDARVLDAMRHIPRHLFVRKHQRSFSYAGMPIAVGYGQTVSQPYLVALMTQALELKGGEKVLEIGNGSGYQAAILGSLAREVISVDRHQSSRSDRVEF
jgi:protein-L-isoaspartate(D-aspartate) O-methyltransferase